MASKKEYKAANTAYLNDLTTDPDIQTLPGGVLYRINQYGPTDAPSPKPGSIVLVHYTGRLISGRIFDSTENAPCPPALRLKDLITGWQIALPHMRVGDNWTLYIPAELGYGPKATDGIPGGSTLIFDIQLIGIA